MKKTCRLKRMLSLLLALVLVIGLIPSVSLPAKAAPSATFTVDGATYTVSVQSCTYRGKDYMDKIGAIKFSGTWANGKKVSFNGQLEGAVSFKQYSFTESDCSKALSTTAVYDDGVWAIVLSITRDAVSHTGGSCANPNCSRCGATYAGEHKYVFQSDGTYHWGVCSYNSSHVMEKTPCSGGKATCSEKATCATCQNNYGSVDPDAHSLYIYYDRMIAVSDYYHEVLCHYCSYVVIEPHEQFCVKRKCVCGFDNMYDSMIDPNNHVWGDWEYNDDGTHTRTCEHHNDAKETKVCVDNDTICTDNDICSTCGHVFSRKGGCKPDADGVCTVCGEGIQATVSIKGEVKFHTSLSNALAIGSYSTAEDQAVIKLLEDVSVSNETLVLSSGVFTLDENGFNIQGLETLAIGDQADVTIADNNSISHIVTYSNAKLTLQDNVAIRTLSNLGTLRLNGKANIGELANNGVVHFQGTVTTLKLLNWEGVFYCYGDHDGISVYQDDSKYLGEFYCCSMDCTSDNIGGHYIPPVNVQWRIFDATGPTQEQGAPCVMTDYSCVIVPYTGATLPEDIEVTEIRSSQKRLQKDVHYTWNPETGEFTLKKEAVSKYEIWIIVKAEYPPNLSIRGEFIYTTVELDEDRFLWDGTQKMPKAESVVYTNNDTVVTLVEGKDYYVEYTTDGIKPGTHYVTVYGMGEYIGSCNASFEIYQLDLADKGRITVEEGNWKFTNQEITPQITVYHGDTVLVEGQDYTVSYENNINPGTGTVKVTGMGQYKGTLTETFTISKASIKDVTITGQETPYNGEKQSLNIQVTFNGMTLKEGVDYTLRYTGSTQLQYVGDVTNIDIQGIGDRFQGYSEFRWTIVDAPLSDFTFARIDKDGKELVYNGFPQTPPSDWYVVVKNSQGKELYIVGNWTPVTNVGDVSTFTPSKSTSFTGSIQVPGIITPASLYDVTAYDNFKNRTYTGQSQQVNLRAYMMTKDGQVYELVEGEDYTVSGTTEATEPGTYSLTLTAKGKNFTDSRTVTWSINPVDISQLEITHGAIPAFTYNGNPQTPDTKVYYTYPDGTKVEVPGSWSSVTNVGDDTTFTADSEYFTGSVTVEDLVQPLDITDLLEMEQTGVYHGSKQEPIFRLTGYDSFTYQMSWDRDPIDIGTYTATFTGTKNFTGTVTRTYEVTPRELSITVRLENKFYDGTNDVEVKNVTLEGVMEGDDVALDATDLVITLPSEDAGDYPTAAASGLTLTGEALKNYTYDLNTVALQGEYGGTFDIAKRDVLIIAEEQYLTEGEELDPTMWYVDEGFLPPEGFTVSDVVLTANEDGEIIPSGGIVTNAAGEDVTKNFNLRYYSSSLNLVCTNHVCDEDGFCDNCGGYEMPDTDPGEDSEWEYDDIYLVYNAGQLFWIADHVNNVHNEINVKLMADITVPEGKQWTPIMNFYGTFDGNCKTISGLHVKSEGNEIGFFGGGSYSYGTIKNLGLRNSSFEGASSVGGIAGHHYGTIENCFVDGTVTVTGNRSIGALVGDLSGTVLNCYAYAPVLAGYSNYGYIENGYYLSDTETEDGGKTAEQFASGEVAYLLGKAYGQKIGTDPYPVLGEPKVYYVTGCDGASVYSNTNISGHSWNDATCTEPKTCSVCGETEGDALGHDWNDATCTESKTCSVCGETEGDALGHDWNDATCTDPKTCSVCGETEGEALGHSYEAVFNWSVNHESCEVILTCAHQCGQQITLAAQVTNDTSDPTCTVHTAAVQYEGKDYRDVLDCDIHRTAFDISGHITSFGVADGEVTVRLMQGDTEIASVVSVDGTYRFETIPLGEYTLTVSKLNHVTRTYPLTVSDGTVDQDVKIHLIGDIDGNGKADVTDMAKLYAHIRKTTAITDAYQLQCANVKSGNLNITDVAALYSHIKGIHKLY